MCFNACLEVPVITSNPLPFPLLLLCFTLTVTFCSNFSDKHNDYACSQHCNVMSQTFSHPLDVFMTKTLCTLVMTLNLTIKEFREDFETTSVSYFQGYILTARVILNLCIQKIPIKKPLLQVKVRAISP